jgi:hypothetical protein
MSTTSSERFTASKGKTEGMAFGSANELIGIIDGEYRKCPSGLVFEQGGFLAQGNRGWELYLPKKIVRLKAESDIDKLDDINFGFYGKNRAGEEGILLKVNERIPAHIDSAFKQAPQKQNGTAFLQTAFFTTEQIILRNGESFRVFVLKLRRDGDLAHMDEKKLKALLDKAKYLEPEIDNISGEITDEYTYVPLVLEIEALGSLREILHGKNWRDANRTNKYVHTHLPTVSIWNDIIRKLLNIERDEFNMPPDILGLQHDINRLNAPQGASSTIVTFEADRTPRIMRTFMKDLLNGDEWKEILRIASKNRTTQTRHPNDCYRSEIEEIVKFFELVKKATVEGLPDIQQN